MGPARLNKNTSNKNADQEKSALQPHAFNSSWASMYLKSDV